MTIESHAMTEHDFASLERASGIPVDPPLGANLAALLDRFTASVSNPEAHTVGDFASTVGALHGELSMLAHHFGGDMYATDDVDFDEMFPAESTGLAAEEELQHICWKLSA
ncbi:MAG: hypothetical protein ABL901_16925 [Hyphomicrobiaceae bacterium]